MTDRAADQFCALVRRTLQAGRCYVVLGTDGPEEDVLLIRATGVTIIEEEAAGRGAYVLEGDPSEWDGEFREAGLALFAAMLLPE